MIRTIIISILCGSLASVICRHTGISGIDYWICIMNASALACLIIV